MQNPSRALKLDAEWKWRLEVDGRQRSMDGIALDFLCLDYTSLLLINLIANLIVSDTYHPHVIDDQ